MRYVEPLLRYAAGHIGPADQAQTLFMFLGTAGMRLLPLAEQRAAYREIVEGVNAMPGLGFRMRLENARTITGTDEAYFAALSVNFMFGHVDRDLRRTRQTLLGALDLGGSSTQIAIPRPWDPAAAAAAAVLDRPLVRGGHAGGAVAAKAALVSDRDFTLASYQLFGVNMMRDLVWKHLVERHEAEAEERQITHLTDHIMNPCMLSAHTEASAAGDKIITGTGDAAGCSHVLRTIMWGVDGRRDCRADSPCPLQGHDMPKPNGHIYIANSVFFHAIDSLRQLAPRGLPHFPRPSLREIQDAAKDLCALNHDLLSEQWVNHTRHGFTSHPHCFEAVYAFTLLRDAYGFDMDDHSLRFTTENNGTEIGWALGAALAVWHADWHDGAISHEEAAVDRTKARFESGRGGPRGAGGGRRGGSPGATPRPGGPGQADDDGALFWSGQPGYVPLVFLATTMLFVWRYQRRVWFCLCWATSALWVFRGRGRAASGKKLTTSPQGRGGGGERRAGAAGHHRRARDDDDEAWSV